jgi:hypothetical protein
LRQSTKQTPAFSAQTAFVRITCGILADYCLG